MRALGLALCSSALLLAAVLLGGCSSGEDLALAEAQIPLFRQQVAAHQFAQVYREAADDLRQAATEHDVVALLSAVDRKLGNVQSAQANGWNVNFHTSGTFVALAFKTRFERGSAAETFVYRISGGKALLAGYHINSNALLSN
ncbi:MAG TPA: DUF4019 domain-containing protein [Burkholderiales bacterium]|nr:DUF4019 domain-containing protein [Burkholderiales bacterium]